MQAGRSDGRQRVHTVRASRPVQFAGAFHIARACGARGRLPVVGSRGVIWRAAHAQLALARARSRNNSTHRARLTEDYFDQEIRPRLLSLTNRAIRSALNVSEVYAIRIRHGRVRPHQRHWLTLAELAGAAAPPTE